MLLFNTNHEKLKSKTNVRFFEHRQKKSKAIQSKMSTDWQTVNSKRFSAASGGPPLTKVVLSQAPATTSKYVAPAKREATYDDMFGYSLGSAIPVHTVKPKSIGPAASELVKALAIADEKERQRAEAEAKAQAEDKPVDDFVADQVSILQYGVPRHCLSIPGRAMAAARLRQELLERERYIKEYGDQPPFYEQQQQEQQQDSWDQDDFDENMSESSDEHNDLSNYDQYEFSTGHKRGAF